MFDIRLNKVNPNPRLVWLMDYALAEVTARLRGVEYSDWLSWAAAWKAGERSPGRCVEVSHSCFDQKEQLVWHSLGQLAWGAKEACYDAPQSGWLVIRYIADAMDAFGVAFPQDTRFPLSVAAIDIGCDDGRLGGDADDWRKALERF